jgi:hypothetical protein
MGCWSGAGRVLAVRKVACGGGVCRYLSTAGSAGPVERLVVRPVRNYVLLLGLGGCYKLDDEVDFRAHCPLRDRTGPTWFLHYRVCCPSCDRTGPTWLMDDRVCCPSCDRTGPTWFPHYRFCFRLNWPVVGSVCPVWPRIVTMIRMIPANWQSVGSCWVCGWVTWQATGSWFISLTRLGLRVW